MTLVMFPYVHLATFWRSSNNGQIDEPGISWLTDKILFWTLLIFIL